MSDFRRARLDGGPPDHHLYLQHTLRGLCDTYPGLLKAGLTPGPGPAKKAGAPYACCATQRCCACAACWPPRQNAPSYELFACLKRLMHGWLPPAVKRGCSRSWPA